MPSQPTIPCLESDRTCVAPSRRRAGVLALRVALCGLAAAQFACSRTEPPPPPATATPSATAGAEAQAPAAEKPTGVAVTPIPFAVVGVEIGRQIGSDMEVSEPTTTFAPGDTIYVSVASVGASDGIPLAARWTYGSARQSVTEQSQEIAPTRPAHTEFHVAMPSGWPLGTYEVEIRADGEIVGSKSFEVK